MSYSMCRIFPKRQYESAERSCRAVASDCTAAGPENWQAATGYPYFHLPLPIRMSILPTVADSISLRKINLVCKKSDIAALVHDLGC